MDREQVARRITRVSYLTGSFRLRSGQVSDRYFDKYQFEADPELLRAIAEGLGEILPEDTDIVAGLELGGVPLATALSLTVGLPMVQVRKRRKEYGTQKLAEGPPIEGRWLCLIEDVVTTGGQVVQSAEDLRAEGALVSNAICVIQREESASQKLAEAGIILQPLFTMDELLRIGVS
jgi:orotate phosphoribosyltransferase